MSTPAAPDLRTTFRLGKPLFSFIGVGTSSRRSVEVAVYIAERGSGISFLVPPFNKGTQDSERISIPAHANFVVNTLRNVVLGKDGARICFVEHILAAAALWGAPDLLIAVDGPEIPLGDGSASFWIELFEQSQLKRQVPKPAFDLRAPHMVVKGDSKIIALPSNAFSITYLMDWQHPVIGKRWCTWSVNESIDLIAQARTFSSEKERHILGLNDDFVSLTADGFSKSLRFEDEPVRHKLLDLFGDLTLCGVNPLSIKAHFISIKGGHELDVQMVCGLLKQGFIRIEE